MTLKILQYLSVVTFLCFYRSVAAELVSKYPFSVVLLSDESRGYYSLHWNFSLPEKIINFAVNVSTTGWVGFGLSPNGGMVGSDMVIGWVSHGAAYFKDRYADALAIPPVDISQDYCLEAANENNGYTILEFSRKLMTCDIKDQDITTDTARVLWSFNPSDPENNIGSNLRRHTQRGVTSVNLLGGNPEEKTREYDGYLDVHVSDVTIPANRTTYWCKTLQLPSEMAETTKFINRVSPVISPHSHSLVHHILIYLCSVRANPDIAKISQPCNELKERRLVLCRGYGALIIAWSYGGADFAYPEGISFPIGGAGKENLILMEIHYNNPDQIKGVVDNSGLRFYYSKAEPQNRAGVMFLGVEIDLNMFLPPRTKQFTLFAVCSAECTNEQIPPEGIIIMGNILHTHLAGRSLVLSQYRRDPITNQLVELEPLDQNLNYDFNFQQITHISPRQVKPGDILVLKCTYDTSDRSAITYGGLPTTDEMCLTIPMFYPLQENGNSLVSCKSALDLDTALDEFKDYAISNKLTTKEKLSKDIFATLENLDWTSDTKLASILQSSIMNGKIHNTCSRENSSRNHFMVPFPLPDVSYQLPDMCHGVRTGQLTSTCSKDGDQISGSPAPSKGLSVLAGIIMCIAYVWST